MSLSYAEQETFGDMDMIENKAGLFQNLRKRWSGTWGGDVQSPEEEGGQVVPHVGTWDKGGHESQSCPCPFRRIPAQDQAWSPAAFHLFELLPGSHHCTGPG